MLDGDIDGSYECLRQLKGEFANLCPIVAEPGGQHAALEVGVRRASGDVVLLMDDDVIAGPGLVSYHARSHVGSKGLVVMGYMPVRLDGHASLATRLYASEYEGHCQRLESGALAVLNGLWLGNVSVRRNDLIRVGVSSDRFSQHWHRDTDLGLRLQADGARGLFDRRLEAIHLHAQSSESFLRAGHERGQSTWLLEAEHGERIRGNRPDRILDGLSVPGPSRRVVPRKGRKVGVEQPVPHGHRRRGRTSGFGEVVGALCTVCTKNKDRVWLPMCCGSWEDGRRGGRSERRSLLVEHEVGKMRAGDDPSGAGCGQHFEGDVLRLAERG